jgi:hypothetical protein
MRNLLRCHRGSAAFATVIALVPLIGAVALGAEAGSWYVTKQHAQTAADAAAYSGALRLACTINGASSTCNDTNTTVDYRGKQFAAQNAFCNAGDTSYPGSRCAGLPRATSQTVTIELIGTNQVKATVSQTQPTYLAGVLGLSTVTIAATATAQVQVVLQPPCVLALTGSLSFQGSPNINANNCGMASNDKQSNALNFTGGGMTFTSGSVLSTAGGCQGSATFCNRNNTFTNMPPDANPFAPLDAALTSMCGANPGLPAKCGLTACKTGTKTAPLVPYTTANPCVNDGVKTTGNTAVTLTAGVYFISGTLTLVGGSSVTGTGVTFILLPGSTIDTKGGGILNLSGPTTAPSASSLPAAFQSNAFLFQYMSIYDASATAVTFGGNSNINLTGNIYAPNAAVTFQGNPTINVGNGTSCGQLIAASIAFNGNATFNSSGCPAKVALLADHYVQLVQ